MTDEIFVNNVVQGCQNFVHTTTAQLAWFSSCNSADTQSKFVQEQGNDLFKRGLQLNKKYFVQQAIVKYTEGLKIDRLPQGATKSMLHGNRAQAHLRILNNRSALEDAVTALSIDSSNVKVRQPAGFPPSLLSCESLGMRTCGMKA